MRGFNKYCNTPDEKLFVYSHFTRGIPEEWRFFLVCGRYQGTVSLLRHSCQLSTWGFFTLIVHLETFPHPSFASTKHGISCGFSSNIVLCPSIQETLGHLASCDSTLGFVCLVGWLVFVFKVLGRMWILCVRRPWCLLGLDQRGVVSNTSKERTLPTSWCIP